MTNLINALDLLFGITIFIVFVLQFYINKKYKTHIDTRKNFIILISILLLVTVVIFLYYSDKNRIYFEYSLYGIKAFAAILAAIWLYSNWATIKSLQKKNT